MTFSVWCFIWTSLLCISHWFVARRKNLAANLKQLVDHFGKRGWTKDKISRILCLGHWSPFFLCPISCQDRAQLRNEFLAFDTEKKGTITHFQALLLHGCFGFQENIWQEFLQLQSFTFKRLKPSSTHLNQLRKNTLAHCLDLQMKFGISKVVWTGRLQVEISLV